MRLAAYMTAALAASLFCGSAWGQQNPSNRMTGLKLSGDEPIQIESDKLEVRDGEGVAIFTGNVNVVQGPTVMKSGRMKVFYARNADDKVPAPGEAGAGNIDRLEVDGKVYVKSQTQEATADQAAFDMKTETLVMSGKEVVLSDGGNVIVGCKLTVKMATGMATLDGCGGTANKSGRVKMLLQPKAATQ